MRNHISSEPSLWNINRLQLLTMGYQQWTVLPVEISKQHSQPIRARRWPCSSQSSWVRVRKRIMFCSSTPGIASKRFLRATGNLTKTFVEPLPCGIQHDSVTNFSVQMKLTIRKGGEPLWDKRSCHVNCHVARGEKQLEQTKVDVLSQLIWQLSTL